MAGGGDKEDQPEDEVQDQPEDMAAQDKPIGSEGDSIGQEKEQKDNLSGKEIKDKVKELTQPKGEGDGDKGVQATMEMPQTPMQMIGKHPGFANYLKFKEHMLSHYKDPAVKQYMENKINKYEMAPEEAGEDGKESKNMSSLAAIYHVLHRSKHAAEQAGNKPDVRTMMTPEQTARFEEIKGKQPASEAAKLPDMPSASNIPTPEKYLSSGPVDTTPESKKVVEAAPSEVEAPEKAPAKTIIRRPGK